jgi:hypothetical protein
MTVELYTIQPRSVWLVGDDFAKLVSACIRRPREFSQHAGIARRDFEHRPGRKHRARTETSILALVKSHMARASYQ